MGLEWQAPPIGSFAINVGRVVCCFDSYCVGAIIDFAVDFKGGLWPQLCPATNSIEEKGRAISGTRDVQACPAGIPIGNDRIISESGTAPGQVLLKVQVNRFGVLAQQNKIVIADIPDGDVIAQEKRVQFRLCVVERLRVQIGMEERDKQLAGGRFEDEIRRM